MPSRNSGNIRRKGGKWLAGVTAEDPLTKAAETALSTRLDYVAFHLYRAASSADEHPEFVHQLRVSSRRAAAALAAFRLCWPPRRARKMRRRLRRIRRAAGAARDIDVLLLRFVRSDMGLGEGERRSVVRFLAQQRQDAQRPLWDLAKKLPSKRFAKKIVQLTTRTRWRGDGAEPTVYQAGQQHMRDVTGQFCDASRELTTDTSIEALHQLRITAKRLRYTIELFACVADGRLRRDVYPLVEELQDKLGAMNDHATAERHFRQSSREAGSSALQGCFKRLADLELQRVEESADAFRRWWNESRLMQIHNGALEAFPPSSAA